MKKKFVYVLFACLAMVNMALGQQNESRLALNPEVPVAGKSLELTYNPQGGPLEGKSDLVGIVYMYNLYHWEMGDVQLKQEGDLWKGTFEIPENCAFIAFKFQSTFTLQPDSTDNNNDNGFMFIPQNSAGDYLPGRYLAWGVFRMPSLGSETGNYFSGNYKEISNEAAMMWTDQETKRYPQYGRHFFRTMKSVLRKMYGDNSRPGIAHLLKVMESQPDLTENEYEEISSTYRIDLKNKVKADT